MTCFTPLLTILFKFSFLLFRYLPILSVNLIISVCMNKRYNIDAEADGDWLHPVVASHLCGACHRLHSGGTKKASAKVGGPSSNRTSHCGDNRSGSKHDQTAYRQQQAVVQVAPLHFPYRIDAVDTFPPIHDVVQRRLSSSRDISLPPPPPTSPPPLTAPEPPDEDNFYFGNQKVKATQQPQLAPSPSEASFHDDEDTATGTRTSHELIIENHHQLDGTSALPLPHTSFKPPPSTQLPDSQPAARDLQPEESQDVVASHLDATVDYSIDDICDLTIADSSHDDVCI